MLIKDNIDTADKMMTTAGSLALVGSKPPKDSFVAQKLRAAGAVILGKTNLSEWANIRSEPLDQRMERARRADEESLRAGPQSVRIEFGHRRGHLGEPGGGGHWHGDGRVDCLPVVVERAGRDQADGGTGEPSGIIPISHSQDGAGPMCRTVRDAAILLGALTGVDPEDAATAASAGKSQTDYAQYCDPNGLKGARIGVARKYFGFSDAVDALMEQSLGVMKQQGATLVDPADIETLGKFDDSELLVFLYELKADLNAYLARLGPGAPVRTLQDIIEFNERNRQKEMPYFGQDIFVKVASEGAADRESVSGCAGEESSTGAHGGH